MVCYADRSMIARLKQLWHNCYPADIHYCDFYFERYFTLDHCCVFVGEEGIETAIYWFDAIIHVGTENLPMLLLYAGATFPEKRQKGNVSKLLDFIAEHCKRNRIYGYVLNALPTSKKLTEKYGMIPNIYMTETIGYPSTKSTPWHWKSCNYLEFAKMRKVTVDCHPYSIYWEGKELKYMYEDIHESGKILKTEVGDQSYYAVVTRNKDYLIIKENNVPINDAQQMVDGICSKEGYYGPVKLLTREGEIPEIKDIIESSTKYNAHSYIVIPHEKLICFQKNPCNGAKPYINLCAN